VVSQSGDSVYVTGIASAPNGSSGYGTVGYDTATGTQVWSALYTGPDPKRTTRTRSASARMAASCFVTGRSYGPTDADYATVVYEAAP
jgi:hypothetical protein